MNGDPERILVTADLHFGLYTAGDECNLKLAEFVRGSDADVFALCGDIADTDTDRFKACLDLFASFRGLKLLVPGNHDLWSVSSNSAEKYREVLPALAADCGFSMLDTGPEVAGRVGFIGNIGWYDYSFRNKQLNVPLHQYEAKELPGVCVWNDGRFIDWDMTDREFTDKCLRKLLSAYRAVEERVHTVVALMHHVPFRKLLYDHSNAAFEFCRAYLGSERFGRLLLDCPKVRYVFCGHRHAPDEAQINGTRAFSIGSDYQVKRLIDLDLTTGEHTVHVFTPDGETGHNTG